MSAIQTHLSGQDGDIQDRRPEIIISNAEKRIPFFTALLPSMIVVIFSGGLAIFIVSWFSIHQAQGLAGYETGLLNAIRNGTFIVDESYAIDGRAQEAPLRGLVFSSIATHTISLTTSFLMALVAYCIAALWLEDSRWRARHGQPSKDHNITPVQYGLLLGILGAPSIVTVYNGLRYALRKETRRSKLPSMFIEPLIMASTLLFLNYAIGVSDLWLHSATRSTAATLALPNVMVSASEVQLGVTLSQSLCLSSGAGVAAPSLDCLAHANGWAAGDEAERIMPASWLVLYNATTAPFRVVTLADQNNTAVIVSTIPKALGPLVTSSFFYEAPTIAVRSSCNIITGNCTQDQKGHVTDCSNIGAPYLPLKWNFTKQSRPKCDFSICFPNRIFGVVDGQIGSFTDYTVQAFDPNITVASAPMVLGMQLQLNQDNVFYDNPREDVTHTVDRRDTLYATCQIEYLSGVVSYDPGTDRYVLSQENYVSPKFASVLWGPLISQYGTNRLIADILGPIMSDPSMLVPSDLIASNLARIALGLLGGVMQGTPATSVVPARQGVLGLYPVAPVFCVAGILYAYAFCATFILFASLSSSSYTVIARPEKGAARDENLSSTKPEGALVLAQVWLTNPLPLIASVFTGKDGRDPQRSIAGSSLNMVFDEEKSVDYLEIGRMKIGDEMKFGLGRRKRVRLDGKRTLGVWFHYGLSLEQQVNKDPGHTM
ncbi:hypothetical protein FS837_005727 [Tulasnella sp. UAMH 9824]|nr:hypothetical protein FS837_005727 [Tulasnella sp. UAMH 9824]